MAKKTQLKLHTCSSLACDNYDCDYCPNCSHAYYRGTATISGRKYEWEFNPYHGPLFACKEIGKESWLPHHRHDVWKKFEKWYTRYFSNTQRDRREAYGQRDGSEGAINET